MSLSLLSLVIFHSLHCNYALYSIHLTSQVSSTHRHSSASARFPAVSIPMQYPSVSYIYHLVIRCVEQVARCPFQISFIRPRCLVPAVKRMDRRFEKGDSRPMESVWESEFETQTDI